MAVTFETKKTGAESQEKTEQKIETPKTPQEAAEAAYQPLAEKGRRLTKLQEALQILEGMDSESSKKLAESLKAQVESLQSDFEAAKIEFDSQFSALRPDIAAEGAQTFEQKNQAEMKNFFKEDESTIVKNYDAQGNEIKDKEPDLTTAQGRQEHINSQESDYEKTVKEIDNKPETLEEKNQRVINATESDYEKAVREIDNTPQTLEQRNQEVINKEFPNEVGTAMKTGRMVDGKEVWDKEIPDNVTAPERIPARAGETRTERPAESKWKKSWGWLKERFKGLATIGIYEFHQAERFRSGTKKVTKELSNIIDTDLQRNIRRIGGGADVDYDRRLTMEEALGEAERIQELSRGENKKELTKEDYKKYSEQITNEKIAENDAMIQSMVSGAEARITQSLEKYKDEFGKSVLTEEKMADFRKRLTQRLQDVRKGIETKNGFLEGIANNPDALKNDIRESLDPKYWKRYVYGGVEVALVAVAAKVAVSKLTAEAAIAHMPSAPVGPSGFEDLNMHKTVWDTAKGFMQDKLGIPNPTNSEVLKLTDAMTRDNGIGVLEWGTSGNPMDVAMQEGFKLKMGGPLTRVAIEALKHAI